MQQPNPNNKNHRLLWIFALSSAIYFTQGIQALPSQGLFYYLKENLLYSPQKIMVITSITTLAWLIKPLIGYAIDSFLNKRAWIFISVIVDIILSLFLGLATLPVFLLVTLLMSTSASAAFRDVTIDGIMCVEGKLYQSTGKIQSIQWASISVAGLLTGIGGGFLAEKWGYKGAFLCLIPVYILVGLIAFFFKEHKAQSPGERKTLGHDMKRL
ncbi:MAG: hypothetical protein NTY47_08505, partial [Candidatus Omnitrophica bacterium]|nr:hypothetical protein [Candidatus Omnitrophota bacterium]